MRPLIQQRFIEHLLGAGHCSECWEQSSDKGNSSAPTELAPWRVMYMGDKWLLAVVCCAGCACKEEQTSQAKRSEAGSGGRAILGRVSDPGCSVDIRAEDTAGVNDGEQLEDRTPVSKESGQGAGRVWGFDFILDVMRVQFREWEV